MKKGLKFWSKLLIASFFLGGMATSAMAQNGASTAFVDCQKSPMLTFTRTANQMATGTKIPITFTDLAADDEIFFVAKGVDGDNGGQGHLRSVDMECSGIVIGNNLQLGSGTADALNNIIGFTPNANSSVANGGIRKEDFSGSVIVRATDITDAGNYTGGDYYLGVFVKSSTTQCYSDVYYIKIDILQNIYASLVLNNGNPYEYICHGTKTTTNIGFTMCNLPGKGTLTYTVNADADAHITGHNVYASGNDGADMTPNLTTWNATITDITPEATHTQPVTNTVFEDGYTVQIGQQTLSNANVAVAEQVVFSFSNMTYTYKVDNNGDGDTDDQGETITLPVVMESAAGYCHAGNYDTEFTVHVAPNFGVQALAFKDDATRDGYTQNPAGTMSNDATLLEPEFCQGTYGYFRAINSTTEGDITYAWTGTPTLNDDASATPDATIQFTDLTTNAYALNVVATWNKDAKFGAGCTALDEMPITINKAPILLLATDKATSGDDLTWNSTDVITYKAPVCPGEIIKIETDASATILATDDANDMVGDADPRYNYMIAGDYVQANGAQIKYTISPNDEDPAVGAYTTWRTVQPAGDGTENLNVAHHLNNGTDASATITYTLENASNAADACALVKSDGSSLPNGQVKVVYTVSPRPQFQLGAN